MSQKCSCCRCEREAERRKFRSGDCVTVAIKAVVVGPDPYGGLSGTGVVVQTQDGELRVVGGETLTLRDCEAADAVKLR